ncbi:MAG: SurA N-terminal domain-containing protein [Magnetococcales bacterium]|nr:SurA N-terminal domain-containing protein [Magnetococcales bacterium]
MLNVMRSSANSLVIKALLILIALSFVVWGVGDYVSNGARTPVASINGQEITAQEFVRAYNEDFNQAKQFMGAGFDKKTADALGMKERTLSRLFERHLLIQTSRDLGLAVSDENLRSQISDDPAFQENGAFSNDRYKLILRNNRMNPRDFEAQLIRDLTTNQLRSMGGTAIALPTHMLVDTFNRESEKRRITTLTLNPSALNDEITPDDDTLIKYLEDQPERFTTQPTVTIRYVLLDNESVRDVVKVTDGEIQEHYNEHKPTYRVDETRRARHILIKPDAKVPDGWGKALVRIQAAKKRIELGDSFVDVAKEISQDDMRGQEKVVQELTDRHVKLVDDVVAKKENDIMQV